MNINNIGIFIATLRKELNMTQSDVADALHISHQAVSKWERLESLPDITLLPELAKLFNVTMEELLQGKRFKEEERQNINSHEEIFINDVAIENIEEAKQALRIIENKTEILKEIAPITKPKVLDQVMDDIEFELEEIEDFLPFLGVEVFDKIINQAIKTHTIHKLQEEIYPFLNEEHKDKLIEYYINHETDMDVEELYPFISSAHKEKLIHHFLGRADMNSLEELYPFLGVKEKNIVIDKFIEAKAYKYIEDLMPFIDEEQKSRIIEQAVKDNISRSRLSDWAPFLSGEQLINLIKKQ